MIWTKLEIFEYIEEFYNRVRRHKHLAQLSPMAFEQRQIALWKVSMILGECQLHEWETMHKYFLEITANKKPTALTTR